MLFTLYPGLPRLDTFDVAPLRTEGALVMTSLRSFCDVRLQVLSVADKNLSAQIPEAYLGLLNDRKLRSNSNTDHFLIITVRHSILLYLSKFLVSERMPVLADAEIKWRFDGAPHFEVGNEELKKDYSGVATFCQSTLTYVNSTCCKAHKYGTIGRSLTRC